MLMLSLCIRLFVTLIRMYSSSPNSITSAQSHSSTSDLVPLNQEVTDIGKVYSAKAEIAYPIQALLHQENTIKSQSQMSRLSHPLKEVERDKGILIF